MPEEIKICEPPPNEIEFFTSDQKCIIKLCDNGDIYVHGKIVENDREVVQGMREFLLSFGYLEKKAT